MRRVMRLVGVIVMTVVLLTTVQASVSAESAPPPPAAAPAGTCAPDGVQESGSIYRICMPPQWRWNGDLLIWAHGYVAFNEPLAIPEDQLCAFDGLCLNDIANGLGFAFATNSYSTNGLAVRQGKDDILDLVDIFTAEHGAPNRVLLVGASEGGIITTLSVEQYPDVYDGGLAICGPIGSWRGQINYFGDARVLFDYFFGNKLNPPMGDPLNIPQWLIDDWDNYYADVVVPVVFDPANAGLLSQWVATASLPYDPADYDATVAQTVEDVLWYSVFATNDGREKLNGQPFDNRFRWYIGSNNDLLLNLLIRRVGADAAAVQEMAAYYETTGSFNIPLVTLHTIYDQQTPYWHEPLYALKVLLNGNPLNFVHFPALRYGHCQVEVWEALGAFGVLYLMTTGQRLDPQAVARLLPDAADQARYREFMKQNGAAVPDSAELAARYPALVDDPTYQALRDRLGSAR